MADINYNALPEKTTPSVSGDKVIITDSENGDIVSIQEALQFKGPQGDIGPQGIQGIQGIQGVQGIQGEQGGQGIQGVPGDNAPELEIEYSIDGVTSWHTPFTSGDFYQRVSTDGGATWSNAIKFVGTDGTGVGDMLKSENLSGLSNYTTARTNLGLNTTVNQTDSTDKRFMTDAQEAKLDAISGTNTGDNAVNSLYSGLTTSKQDVLVSGTNIKTINGTSILGSGDIVVVTTKQHRITIPGEQIADTSNYQGLYFYNDTGTTITISNVAFAVGKAAAGSGAACAINIYKSSGTAVDGLNTSAINLFTTAIDLGTGYTSLTNVPNTTTVEAGRWVTLRVTSSAGATNKSSDLQCIITYS